MDFLTNFRDKVSVKESMEVLRIARSGFGKHAFVDDLINRTTLHFGGGDGDGLDAKDW